MSFLKFWVKSKKKKKDLPPEVLSDNGSVFLPGVLREPQSRSSMGVQRQLSISRSGRYKARNRERARLDRTAYGDEDPTGAASSASGGAVKTPPRHMTYAGGSVAKRGAITADLFAPRAAADDSAPSASPRASSSSKRLPPPLATQLSFPPQQQQQQSTRQGRASAVKATVVVAGGADADRRPGSAASGGSGVVSDSDSLTSSLKDVVIGDVVVRDVTDDDDDDDWNVDEFSPEKFLEYSGIVCHDVEVVRGGRV